MLHYWFKGWFLILPITFPSLSLLHYFPIANFFLEIQINRNHFYVLCLSLEVIQQSFTNFIFTLPFALTVASFVRDIVQNSIFRYLLPLNIDILISTYFFNSTYHFTRGVFRVGYWVSSLPWTSKIYLFQGVFSPQWRLSPPPFCNESI